MGAKKGAARGSKAVAIKSINKISLTFYESKKKMGKCAKKAAVLGRKTRRVRPALRTRQG